VHLFDGRVVDAEEAMALLAADPYGHFHGGPARA
jgi:hypothetical protein